ncbi:MAG TPA: RsbRD N-terminal domain-containing protein [Spirochaetota bacterium]|nr:RsbRD N-terminal domain-containing protein [Spirochaetota bacterium]HOD14397.1 RsbRD N-terminal domain-containing protein [Spirochaetota bacterium]HPG50052.1 RsbRD N-terminal domain-containing protein [Spirochaetota bacterium]HPN13261.1 RsbRD N-terminal domain-containing protein [Spirochaetota bacterium]HQL81261.1 RsbRD N-terminal domain-containing protein [Spirochaetota bacterium]
MKDLIKQKNIIVQKWLDAVIDSYQPETALFFNNNSNQFKNPAGILIKKSIETLALFVLKGSDPGGGSDPGTGSDRDAATRALTDILSLRAVQDFSPSGAVDFIPALRGIVREVAGADAATQLEARIDELLLMAFDIYQERREKISGLRVRELRGGMLRAAEGKE